MSEEEALPKVSPLASDSSSELALPSSPRSRRRSSFDCSNATPTNPLQKLLSKTEVSKIAPDRKEGTIVINDETSVEKCVKILGSKKILAAPLLNKSKEVVQFLSVLDLIRYINAVAPDVMDGIPSPDLKTTAVKDALKVSQSPLLRPRTTGADRPFVCIMSNSTADALLNTFASDVHRVAVLNDKRLVHTTCSQTDVTRFIEQVADDPKAFGLDDAEAKSLGLFVDTSVKDLGFTHSVSPVVTILEHAPVLKALQLLDQRHVSSLAVIDNSGHLVGNISASDMRGLYAEHMPHFLKSVKEFLLKNAPNSIRNLLTTSKSTSLIEIIKKMISNRVHHLWICSADNKPVDMITLTDVLRIVASQ